MLDARNYTVQDRLRGIPGTLQWMIVNQFLRYISGVLCKPPRWTLLIVGTKPLECV